MKDESFVDRGTTFRRFVSKTFWKCSLCPGYIARKKPGWKPTGNEGGWKPDARICEGCGNKKLAEQKAAS